MMEEIIIRESMENMESMECIEEFYEGESDDSDKEGYSYKYWMLTGYQWRWLIKAHINWFVVISNKL